MLSDAVATKRSLPKRSIEERDVAKKAWLAEKRDLTGRANGTIDEWYGCFLLEESKNFSKLADHRTNLYLSG
jgi:carboxypeptidase D